MSSLTTGEIYDRLSLAVERRERVALATVAATYGATPQREGARMLIFEDGRMLGTVGGGCVEAEVFAEARQVMRSGEPGLFRFELTAETDAGEGAGDVCGGVMEIFIEPWPRKN